MQQPQQFFTPQTQNQPIDSANILNQPPQVSQQQFRLREQITKLQETFLRSSAQSEIINKKIEAYHHNQLLIHQNNLVNYLPQTGPGYGNFIDNRGYNGMVQQPYLEPVKEYVKPMDYTSTCNSTLSTCSNTQPLIQNNNQIQFPTQNNYQQVLLQQQQQQVQQLQQQQQQQFQQQQQLQKQQILLNGNQIQNLSNNNNQMIYQNLQQQNSSKIIDDQQQKQKLQGLFIKQEQDLQQQQVTEPIINKNDKNTINNSLQLNHPKIQQQQQINSNSINDKTHNNINTNSNQQQQQKITTTNKEKQFNTSHVPINMINNLTTYLLAFYNDKIPCRCSQLELDDTLTSKVIIKKEEKCSNSQQQQRQIEETTEESDQIQQCDVQFEQTQQNEKLEKHNNKQLKCQRCQEYQKIEALKKNKIKNIQSIKVIWTEKRIRILSEHYFTHYAYTHISSKKYRSHNNRQALIRCLPAFFKGARKPKQFWKLI